MILSGLLASNAVGALIYSIDRRDVVASTEALDLTDRVAGVIELVRNLPTGWSNDIIRVSNSRTFSLFVSAEPTVPETDDDELASDISNDLRQDLHGAPGLPIHVSLSTGPGLDRPESKMTPGPAARASTTAADGNSQKVVHISVQLDGGRWLNFSGLVPKAKSLWPGWAGIYALSVVLVVSVAALWLVTRATRPLTVFARAADQLGKNIRSDPLPEKGPAEVLEASRALNDMQQRLRRLIENRTQMLAAISHDLRTPITLLRLQAELLGDHQAQAKQLRTIGELEAMIASILDFTKETFSDEPQRTVDLAALVESVCEDLADTGAAVSFSPSRRVLYSCRRIALKRAISNLVDNAVKYGKAATVTLEDTAAVVRIVIDDKGPGLAEGQLKQVFMPFYRGDESRSRDTGGAGLGLSIAQAIVHGHGGTLTLSNRADGGLRVQVSLPK